MKSPIFVIPAIALALSSVVAHAQESKSNYGINISIVQDLPPGQQMSAGDYNSQWDGKKKKDKDKAPAVEEPKPLSLSSKTDMNGVKAFLAKPEVQCIAVESNKFLDSLDRVVEIAEYKKAQSLYHDRCLSDQASVPVPEVRLEMAFTNDLKTGHARFTFKPLPGGVADEPVRANYASSNQSDSSRYQATVAITDWGRTCNESDGSYGAYGSNSYEPTRIAEFVARALTTAAMECKGKVATTPEAAKAINALGSRLGGGSSSAGTPAPGPGDAPNPPCAEGDKRPVCAWK